MVSSSPTFAQLVRQGAGLRVWGQNGQLEGPREDVKSEAWRQVRMGMGAAGLRPTKPQWPARFAPPWPPRKELYACKNMCTRV